MEFRFVIGFAFAAIFQSASGANVLYLSNIPSPSHFIWCKSILTSLHENGHNITALSPDVEQSTENFTYLHLNNIYPTLYNTTEINYFEMGQKSFIATFIEFASWYDKICLGSFNSKGFKQLSNYPDDFKFDLVIYDFTISQCLLGFVHKFKYPPMIAVSPFLFSGKLTQLSGSLAFPAFFPPADSAKSQILNFKQRVVSTIETVFEIMFTEIYANPKMNRLLNEKYPGIPSIDEIERKATKMIMVNTQPITDYRQPAFPHVKLVGGAQIKKPKALPDELRKIVDNSPNGVVLFSLGTNVRSDTLGNERILNILKAFGRLNKYKFVWKFETKEKLPIALPQNVEIQPWIPQNDVLAHPNTKLFISHCGLLSSQEALWYGVPVLGFPVFADQPQNAFRLKELGVSETLSVIDFTEDQLYETVRSMLENPKYQKKIKAISFALRDQPMTPLEEVTYWAEWLLRHPEVDFASPSLHLSLFARHSLDVFALFIIVTLLVFLIWWQIMKRLAKKILVRVCLRDKKPPNDKKKSTNFQKRLRSIFYLDS